MAGFISAPSQDQARIRASSPQPSHCRQERPPAKLGLVPDADASVVISMFPVFGWAPPAALRRRSEEHTSELQSLMRISYAVFCLKKNNLSHRADNPKP